MNMIAAFKRLQLAEAQREHVWIRPKRWKGLNAAYCIGRDGNVQIVPSSRGGERANMPSLDVMFGEWEVVDPGDVNKGL